MSPVFKREEGFVFKVFSNEEERMHIHVVSAEKEAKFWLEPEISLSENFGFNSKELKRIKQIVETHGDDFKRQYKQHVSKRIND